MVPNNIFVVSWPWNVVGHFACSLCARCCVFSRGTTRPLARNVACVGLLLRLGISQGRHLRKLISHQAGLQLEVVDNIGHKFSDSFDL
ncbi:hypothetical protein BDQ94DRAFT_132337 [Aspergillus welwitschiae]|uniref:Uncharacterized protein n=1 Tax=Aspergillus welwitschiae TaxID=1341132 RepID=A0A3F3QIY8_9EURO|nr:hypothetical protein BDQ94DRAFT_132337 [Aspergillus welwitschiae]RDH39087.1 hypothetical protein BDQ94DRAFT_132337 [Aspergillus welwitschiae]